MKLRRWLVSLVDLGSQARLRASARRFERSRVQVDDAAAPGRLRPLLVRDLAPIHWQSVSSDQNSRLELRRWLVSLVAAVRDGDLRPWRRLGGTRGTGCDAAGLARRGGERGLLDVVVRPRERTIHEWVVLDDTLTDGRVFVFERAFALDRSGVPAIHDQGLALRRGAGRPRLRRMVCAVRRDRARQLRRKARLSLEGTGFFACAHVPLGHRGVVIDGRVPIDGRPVGGCVDCPGLRDMVHR